MQIPNKDIKLKIVDDRVSYKKLVNQIGLPKIRIFVRLANI